MLDPDGDVGSLPGEVAVGEEAAAVIGIVNRERRPIEYEVTTVPA